MDKTRFKENHEHRFSISVPTEKDPTLIVCPKCSNMAKILTVSEQPGIGHHVKLVCKNCGLTKESIGTERSFNWHETNPTDGYFGYQLWLVIPCCGESLWAFNIRHLNFLHNFVSAELRERDKDESGWHNSSFASRLPKWLKSSKNREKIISCLIKLKRKL